MDLLPILGFLVAGIALAIGLSLTRHFKFLSKQTKNEVQNELAFFESGHKTEDNENLLAQLVVENNLLKEGLNAIKADIHELKVELELEDSDDDSNDYQDELYDAAKKTVIETQKASPSFLQRRFGIGYARAAKLLDLMEQNGVVGPVSGAKPRTVLQTEDNLSASNKLSKIYKYLNSKNYSEEDEGDDLYSQAKDIVIQTQKASASNLQRRLGIGYARAALLLDLLEGNGIIGPSEGAKPREVYLKKSEIEA